MPTTSWTLLFGTWIGGISSPRMTSRMANTHALLKTKNWTLFGWDLKHKRISGNWWKSIPTLQFSLATNMPVSQQEIAYILGWTMKEPGISGRESKWRSTIKHSLPTKRYITSMVTTLSRKLGPWAKVKPILPAHTCPMHTTRKSAGRPFSKHWLVSCITQNNVITDELLQGRIAK